MDPVSVELLLAIAGGAAGAAGTGAWQGLVALVKRPFVHTPEDEEATAALDALAALQQESGDRVAAGKLASVLQARAGVDAGFRDAVQTWLDRAYEELSGNSGNTHSEISGGTQHGHLLMGRDFSSIRLGASGNDGSSSTAQQALPASAGDVHSEISGGIQHGHVLMGRDFSSITIDIGDTGNAAYPTEPN